MVRPLFSLQLFELRLDHSGDTMLGDVNMRCAHAQRAGDIFHGPLLEHVKVEHLKLFRLEYRFHARKRGVPKVLLPLRVPGRFEIETSRIGNPLDSRCALGVLTLEFTLQRALETTGWRTC